jgi:hypothetical protein
MERELRLQLDTLIAKVDELEKRLDGFALVAAPLLQPESAKRRMRAPKAPSAPTSASNDDIPPRPGANDHIGLAPSEEESFDEDALRVRVEFEAKRTTRQFGISATRAAIARVAGAEVVRLHDVPRSRLPSLLTELQAL